MGRLRKQERQQTEYYLFGINRKTLEVEHATLNKGGELVMWRGDERVVRSAGRNAESECRHVFDWTEVRSMPLFSDTIENKARIEAELSTVAIRMKQERLAAGRQAYLFEVAGEERFAISGIPEGNNVKAPYGVLLFKTVPRTKEAIDKLVENADDVIDALNHGEAFYFARSLLKREALT
jgi:hypothetical protein